VSERYIAICNWDKFQHKDLWRKSNGRPPWIKAYTNLLHNDDWLELPQAQRGLLLGLWLMYASAGRAVSESGAKRLLVSSESDARYWRVRITSLSDAGFIQFVAQPIRAPVAPRSREEVEEDPPSIPPTVERVRQPTEAEIVRAREERESNGYVEGLKDYTGCKIVRGEVGISHVYDPLGTEPKPVDWPYPTPTRQEILEAIARRRAAHVA
jgi:hypothetical protein